MKIEDLKLFMLVVELKSFASAAEALNLPRSTVSRRISDLEDALNTKLITRTTRRLTLTSIGLDYYHNLQELIPQLDKVHEAIRTHSNSPTGRIKIGFLNESDIFTHDILHGFLARFPNIQIETHLTHVGYHDILSYGLDACIHIGPIEDSSFIARPIEPFKRKLYASKSYVEKHGQPRTLDELNSHFLLLYRWPDGHLENAWHFNDTSISVQSRLIVNSSYYIRHNVFSGDGIALLPEVMVREAVQAGDIINVLPECETVSEDLWLVYPSRKGLSHAARLFIDYFLNEMNRKYLLLQKME